MARHYVTIKDIAKILNISVSTVSRALRDTYDVNQETKEKVLALAAELNYKPNFNATGLAKGSTHNLGVILPFITNYYFSTVITGIQEVAYNNGYNITLFVTNDSPERELAIMENLSVSSLDGLLVSISSDSDSCNHFQEIIDEGVPVVFFDRVANEIDTSKVMQDDYNGAFEAVEHLILNGYTKIAHIAGPKGMSFTEARLKGYIDALTKHHLRINEDWIVYSGFSQEYGEQDTYQLLQLKQQPDALFAVNDRKAIGAMIALKNKGIKVGEEFGVIGFTNDPMSTIISPALSTIAEPAFEIGKLSCELLIKHITKPKYFHGEEIVLPGKLIVRESSMRKAKH
ncbi:LacI family DNA-binding transcriptional regulator [Pedobacter heparinus]|uniref:Periplasmic binding protein/LacI transcriptional regulator n=1 Tax=Pedobacter heparinus (strain ATCC 13125 / DSM 2366 / CIP 104194 / JCM 7457 / NBRC 12017 / NCIMB 9290 / NRRL B-14731 / HIM 762-3) TaxID=485917 RepID=C6Y208_PEDHD|nr:LacI family DNA-binding transcriptional regulator [Pedobacter heparinus]ACU03001.1 periplasmic binding protein/LacI transcriptional regulator [Pedobacter heparinus DSM 2366]